MDAAVRCIQNVCEIGTSKKEFNHQFNHSFVLKTIRFYSERCPKCNARIRLGHRVYLNLEELRSCLTQLLELFRTVEDQARRYQNLIEMLERTARLE